MRSPGLAVCLPLLALVLVAGCTKSAGGRGVASANGPAGPHPTPSTNALEQARRHAQCMREHNVPEADPQVQSDGEIQWGGGYDKHDLDPTVLTQAIEACRQYVPVLSAADAEQKRTGALGYARCMRAHGVDKFPDPDANGHFDLSGVQSDPEYKQAAATCEVQVSQSPSPTGSR